MRSFLKFLVLAPVALIILAFAMANRQNVVVSFDPISGGEMPVPQVVLPLFVVVIAAIMVGVILGGFATWLRQGRHRKNVREARTKIEVLRSENDSLRAQARASRLPPSASTAITPTRAA